jgi:hypothetical protein
MPVWNEATYFTRAESLPVATQQALGELYEVRVAEGVRVSFGNGGDGAMKVALDRSGDASVLFAWNHDGSLMLTFQFHQDHRSIVEPLAAFARDVFGLSLDAGWSNTKPYVPAERWTPHVAQLVAFLRRLAADGRP